MINQVIKSVGAFFAAFFVSLIIFFPMNVIISKVIDSFALKNNIDLRYDTLDVGLFSTKFTNLRSKDVKLDSVALFYNPIGLFFKRVNFDIESDLFVATGKLAGDKIDADIKASLPSIAKMLGYEGFGSINAKTEYNIKTNEGKVEISSGAISFAHPLMNIETNETSALVNVKGNLLMLEKFVAQGKVSLDAKGVININPERMDLSVVDISGNANLMGLKSNFKLQGSLTKPNFTTQ